MMLLMLLISINRYRVEHRALIAMTARLAYAPCGQQAR
jgi:hypothetical protein